MNIDKSHWQRVKFGDVVRLNTDRCADPVAARVERYVGLEHIEPGDLRIRRWGLIEEGTTFTNLFRPGQVLFGKRRAYQGKVAVAEFEGVCSGDIYVLEPKNDHLLPELLPFICQTEPFYEYAVGTSAGSLSPRANWTQLSAYEFTLPPLGQQRLIAEALFSIEHQVESLVDALSKAEFLRHSIEKATFAENGHGNVILLGELLRRGTISFQTGPFGTVLQASSYKESGHPVVNPSDMTDGKILLDKCKFVDDREWQRLARYQVRTDDVLIGRKGDMQNIVFIEPEYSGYLVGSDCIRFRVHDDTLVPQYLFHYLRADVTRQWLQAQAYGTTMPGINEKLLARMQLHFPNQQAQLNVVSNINSVDYSRRDLQSRRYQCAVLKRAVLSAMEH